VTLSDNREAKQHLQCRFEHGMICNHPLKPTMIVYGTLQNYKFCDIPSRIAIAAQQG